MMGIDADYANICRKKNYKRLLFLKSMFFGAHTRAHEATEYFATMIIYLTGGLHL